MHFEKYQLPYKCKGPCLSKCVYIHYGIFILRAICHKHFPSSAKRMNMKKVSVKNNFTKALQIVVKIISIFFSFQERQSPKLVVFPNICGYLHRAWFRACAHLVAGACQCLGQTHWSQVRLRAAAGIKWMDKKCDSTALYADFG